MFSCYWQNHKELVQVNQSNNRLLVLCRKQHFDLLLFSHSNIVYTNPVFGKIFHYTFKSHTHHQYSFDPFDSVQKKKDSLTCLVGGAAVCRNLP